jgi:Domain of unknown function (DUF1918)
MECRMRAAPGDRLIVDGNPDRVAEVISVPHSDGSPPYVVRWQRSGHIALVSPDSYACIVPAGSGQTSSGQTGSGQAPRVSPPGNQR